MLATGLANNEIVCAANEFLHFDPPSGKSCGQYMQPWISSLGGYVQNPNATTDCSFCTLSNTNSFLTAVNTSFNTRWRNYGILWVYILFNVGMALLLYWLVRVPAKSKAREVNTAPAPAPEDDPALVRNKTRE